MEDEITKKIHITDFVRYKRERSWNTCGRSIEEVNDEDIAGLTYAEIVKN